MIVGAGPRVGHNLGSYVPDRLPAGMLTLLSKERIVAPAGFNRWKVPPASIAIHLSIGSVYAWSIFNPALIKIRGVVASAAGDWTLSEVVWIFTVAIACLGLSAAVAGKWLERVGPRVVGVISAICWGGGFLVGGVGILMHWLWLLYLGYGVLGGIGLGLGYVSPVSTLIRWFPDRRGMAAGLAIMGFGGGAIIATPLNEALIRHFYEAPEYLGKSSQVALTTEAGRRFAEIDGQQHEVVVIGPQEVSQMIVPGPEGVYVVGTGQTGIAKTFFCPLCPLHAGDAHCFVCLPHPDTRLATGRLGPKARGEPQTPPGESARRGDRPVAPHTAILPGLDRTLFQRDRRHRCTGGRQDDDERDLWRYATGDRQRQLCGHVCLNDQRL